MIIKRLILQGEQKIMLVPVIFNLTGLKNNISIQYYKIKVNN